jgi:hypothetical protein
VSMQRTMMIINDLHLARNYPARARIRERYGTIDVSTSL